MKVDQIKNHTNYTKLHQKSHQKGVVQRKFGVRKKKLENTCLFVG